MYRVEAAFTNYEFDTTIFNEKYIWYNWGGKNYKTIQAALEAYRAHKNNHQQSENFKLRIVHHYA